MNLKDGILTSTLLEERAVVHGFTTRAHGNLGFGRNPGDPEVVANRRTLFEFRGLTSRAHIQPKQQHTDRSILAHEFVSGIEADAVISSDPHDLLSILTADCIPILVYHPDGMIAAIHAGWRGMDENIIGKTLKRVPPGVIAAAGPSIGPCCYEVGDDLADRFSQKFGHEVVIRNAGKKPHLNLRAVAIRELEEAGVEELEVSQVCTFCHPDLFFSYRRDGSSGRMMAFIGLNP